VSDQIGQKDLQLLRAAAAQGQVKIQLQLGRLLKAYPELGETGEWAKWLSQAAERGSGDACWELAEVMIEKRDFKLAFPWLVLGATLASPQCLHHAGLMMLAGAAAPANPQDAFSMFTRAAKLNDVGAQYQLGRCYAKGIGTSPNFAFAKEWLSKAAAAGHARAVAALKQIALGGLPAAASIP
jgi:TPR repeat protein